MLGSRQNQLEGFDQHRGIDPGGAVGVGIGPLLGSAQGFEFGDYQAAGETGRAWVIAVDRGVRAGQHQAAFALQLFQAGQVSRTGAQAVFQGVFYIGGDDGVEHFDP